MKTIKFTAISFFLSFIAINVSIPTSTIVGGLIDMGYGSRGESILRGSTSARSEEPVYPIPINFDYGRAKDLKEQAGGPIVNSIEMGSTMN